MITNSFAILGDDSDSDHEGGVGVGVDDGIDAGIDVGVVGEIVVPVSVETNAISDGEATMSGPEAVGSGDETVVSSREVDDGLTSAQRVELAYKKSVEAIRSRPIPVIPPGGVDLIALSPELAWMHYAMRNGMSWYDMFIYDVELEEYRRKREYERIHGIAEEPIRVETVVERTAWTDVRKSGGGGGRGQKRGGRRRVEYTAEEREARRQESWGW